MVTSNVYVPISVTDTCSACVRRVSEGWRVRLGGNVRSSTCGALRPRTGQVRYCLFSWLPSAYKGRVYVWRPSRARKRQRSYLITHFSGHVRCKGRKKTLRVFCFQSPIKTFERRCTDSFHFFLFFLNPPLLSHSPEGSKKERRDYMHVDWVKG